MRRVLFIGIAVLLVIVVAGIGIGVSVATPARPTAAVRLGEQNNDAAEAGPDSPSEHAQGLLTSGDPAGARSVLEARLETHPSDADAIVLLGRVYMETGDPAQGAVLIKQAVDAHPEHADYRYWYASAMGQEAMGAGTLQQMTLGMRAMEQYNKAIELDPDHVESRKALMFAALFAPSFVGGGEERARLHAEEIARVDPREGNLAFAQLAVRDELFSEAVTLFDEANAMGGEPFDPRVQTQYIRTLHDAGETNRAFAAARSLIERGDVGAEGLYQFGRLSALTGLHAVEALDTLDRYIALGVGDIPEQYVRWRKGQILIDLGRNEDARSELTRALELEPGMDEARTTLSVIE